MDMVHPRTIYNTIGRDIRAVRLYLKTYTFVRRCHFLNKTAIDFFHAKVEKSPNDICFRFEDELWTFQQVNEFSNQVANCFQLLGYEKGDEVALFMENCPEYVCMWMGLAKIGVVTALINTNQKADSLAHSMNVINMKAVIFGQTLAETLKNAIPFLDKGNSDFYCYSRKMEESKNLSFPSKSLNVLLEDASLSLPKSVKPNFQDKMLYIYTSGTTGLPKAAIIRHSRFLWISGAAHFVCQLRTPEVFYNPLPMYHTAGGIVYVGVVLMFGGTMVLRKKFSATNYWKDVVKHKVTVCQYIGEICRYLLNQPKVPEETQHSVWLMFGNGLRPHIWKEFQDRFQIKSIVELYGATEGNANLVNMFGKVGAVGFVSRIFSRIYPVYLIRVNPETGEIVRDKKGLCIRCKPGEPGELVGKVMNNNPLNSFDGYVSTTETKKKIIRDCFRKGDMAFLSGDILVMDDDGYLYFLDRTGDTFRWKGENISTGEVENTVSKVLNHATCIVYGVEIPGVEGRAGMAAIQTEAKIDMTQLCEGLLSRLPTYAIPLFIRICNAIESTGTYKLSKVTLQKEGFNVEVSDPLYMLDIKNKTYIPLTTNIYQDIINGKMQM